MTAFARGPLRAAVCLAALTCAFAFAPAQADPDPDKSVDRIPTASPIKHRSTAESRPCDSPSCRPR